MDQQIAQEILKQIGGNKFIAMTGAKHLVAHKHALSFRFKMCKLANCCKITLNSLDLYDMEFSKFKPSTLELKPVKSFHGLYYDMLEKTFSEFTGLNTRL